MHGVEVLHVVGPGQVLRISMSHLRLLASQGPSKDGKLSPYRRSVGEGVCPALGQGGTGDSQDGTLFEQRIGLAQRLKEGCSRDRDGG